MGFWKSPINTTSGITSGFKMTPFGGSHGEVTVEVKGLNELKIALQHFPQQMADGVIRGALREASKEMQAAIAQAAPVGTDNRYGASARSVLGSRRAEKMAGNTRRANKIHLAGTLKRAIKISTARISRGRVLAGVRIEHGYNTRSRKGQTLRRDDAYYWHMVERGHKTRPARKGKSKANKVAFVEATRFIHETFQSRATQAISEIISEINQALLRKSWGRVG